MADLDSLRTLFPDFSSELYSEIEDVASIKVFEAGDTMMRKGQYFKSTMLIVDGMVKVYREDDEGNEFFMYYLEPGNACALSMICAAKNETSEILAVAVKNTTAILIPLHLMDELMLKHRSWYHFVLETYRVRFSELLNTIDQIAFKAMDERLEFYLKRQKDAFADHDIQLTHQQIANDLGTSREVISRLLKKLEQQGRLKLHRNHIEIISL